MEHAGEECVFSTLRAADAEKIKSDIGEICSQKQQPGSAVIKMLDVSLEIHLSITGHEDKSFDVFCTGPELKPETSEQDACSMAEMGIHPMSLGCRFSIPSPSSSPEVRTATDNHSSMNGVLCDWLQHRLEMYQRGLI